MGIGYCPKGFRPCPHALEHFFKGATYLGKVPRERGDQGPAKHFEAQFKDVVVVASHEGFILFGENV